MQFFWRPSKKFCATFRKMYEVNCEKDKDITLCDKTTIFFLVHICPFLYIDSKNFLFN